MSWTILLTHIGIRLGLVWSWLVTVGLDVSCTMVRFTIPPDALPLVLTSRDTTPRCILLLNTLLLRRRMSCAAKLLSGPVC